MPSVKTIRRFIYVQWNRHILRREVPWIYNQETKVEFFYTARAINDDLYKDNQNV